MVSDCEHFIPRALYRMAGSPAICISTDRREAIQAAFSLERINLHIRSTSSLIFSRVRKTADSVKLLTRDAKIYIPINYQIMQYAKVQCTLGGSVHNRRTPLANVNRDYDATFDIVAKC